MHIPDGFISPKTYIPFYAVCAGLWAWGIKKIKSQLNEETIPFVASMTAFSFIVMMISVPLPGGTTAHMSGIALLAALFGYWTAFISISLVLTIQAVFLGNGGVTSLPINAFAMGFAGSVCAYFFFKLISKWNKSAALFVAGWTSVMLSSLITALVLGIQPLIAHSENGKPLFFPFGLSVTLPAVLIPHLLVGIIEGIATLVIYKFLEKNFKGIFIER